MGLFNKNQAANVQLSQRQVLENTVKISRNNILLVLLFSAINIILRVTSSDTYFLFSAYVPLLLSSLGMELTGKYPPEFYGEDLSSYVFFNDSFLYIMLGISAFILVLYALCWALAKKHPKGWLIVALVLFSIDTALMLLLAGISFDRILDYLFHGWVIVSFAKGLSALKKLKDLPEEPVEPEYIVDAAPAEEEPECIVEAAPVEEAPEAVPVEE